MQITFEQSFSGPGEKDNDNKSDARVYSHRGHVIHRKRLDVIRGVVHKVARKVWLNPIPYCLTCF